MPIAPNHYALKRRVDRYFWSNQSTEMACLTATFDECFRKFPRVAVVGGLVRDFARAGRSGFRSDVDLVIDAPAGTIARLAERVGANPNRFGGYSSKQGPWKIDFWALETTWGRRYVQVSRLEDVIACTFFDWDAIAYDLWERKLIWSDDYMERLRQRVLDINLLPNPSPIGNLLRAVRRLILWDCYPGPRLKEFIKGHLHDAALSYIQRKERELFPVRVSTDWRTAEEARVALLKREPTICKQPELGLKIGLHADSAFRGVPPRGVLQSAVARQRRNCQVNPDSQVCLPLG